MSLWQLVEELIAWQRANAYMDAAGFAVCAVALCWLIVRVRRIEYAIRTMAGGKWSGLLKGGSRSGLDH